MTISFADSTDDRDSTAHEAAIEMNKIGEMWRNLEVAKVEYELLEAMVEREIAVPQVRSIISKMGGARKSLRKTNWDGKVTVDLMKTKLVDAKEHVKESEVKLSEEMPG